MENAPSTQRASTLLSRSAAKAASTLSRKPSSLIGTSEVALDGRRGSVRTTETNEGNLIADALLSDPRIDELSYGRYRSFESGDGKRFEQAGYGQWGLAMQDDLSDAVVWAVTSGFCRTRRKLISRPQVGGHSLGKYWFDRTTRPPR